MPDSEFRLYGYILEALKSLGWNTRSPAKGGQVYTQNEIRHDPNLRIALGQSRPENVVVIGENEYWVIEAKRDVALLERAVDEAEGYANKINDVPSLSCRIVTGIAGSPDTTRFIVTKCLVKGEWKPLVINNRQATGFISPREVSTVIDSGEASLVEYDLDDELFNRRIAEINDILHDGAINKRNRAGVLSCLLLALAQDEKMKVDDDPVILIRDINSRAEQMLKRYGKDSFFDEIGIHLPASEGNHIKYKNALKQSIEILRGMNIASAISSGRDVLGQCYERFLKYANDAKEIGIVLTPRHITTFAAEIVDVQRNDIVFDPACGTGGFLVAALDKVRRDGGDVDNFKKGNLFGIEQDPLVATLAIVNMIFRGDGSSNILEGDSLRKVPAKRPNKVLMNPPFALSQFEWQFVDKALEIMEGNGLLFSILPTTTIGGSSNGRKEVTWRSQFLKKHTLLAVIKLEEELFSPHVSKGTYGVLIKANRPHDIENDNVIWAVHRDSETRTKVSRSITDNTELLTRAIGNFLRTGTVPELILFELDCCPIGKGVGGFIDLSPERHIGKSLSSGSFDISSVLRSLEDGRRYQRYRVQAREEKVENCKYVPLMSFVKNFEKGRSGRAKNLDDGLMPLVSTSESNNGIMEFVDERQVKKVYQSGHITISANGSSCYACYHDYDFAANSDVFVIELLPDYSNRVVGAFICAAVNSENWRYNYYRKFNMKQLERLEIRVPVNADGEID